MKNLTFMNKFKIFFAMAVMGAIGTSQVYAQEVPDQKPNIPNVALSAHEARLFEMLEGYSVKPVKVGYDYELKATEDATPGEFVWQVNRPYYEQFFYSWKDSNGVEHESNLLDRATDHRQMIALLKEVYTNPLIPGFRRDMYRGDREEYDEFKIKNNEDGGSGDIKLVDGKKQYVNNAFTYRSKCETVPYDPCNFGLFRDDKNPMTEVIKPFNGATALLVEMKDDFYSGYIEEIHKENSLAEKLFSQYQEDFKAGKLPPDRAQEGLNYIHSIRVMPLQFYVDPESSENPGFLFNMNASLSKCFIVTKGVNRPYKSYTHRIQVNGENGLETLGAGPGEIWDASNPDSHPFEVDAGSVFYNMYEEFSPSNLGPKADAYAKMSTGSVFQVDHNCSSIIGQEHDIIFGTPENHKQIYNVNLMFFLPDRRFDGVTNKQDNDNRIYSCYTFYPKEHRPYFFFNRIYANIDDKVIVPPNETWITANGEEVMLDNHALVPVHWQSLYKLIIQQNEEESFRIYRMTEGEMQTIPIPWNQIVIRKSEPNEEDGLTYVPDGENDGELRRLIGPDVAIYVIEDNLSERSGESVKYVVHGTRAGSGFEAVESNIVVGYLPNLKKGLTLRLTQAGSKYYDRTNHYSNEVQLVSTDYESGNTNGDTKYSDPGNLKYSDILSGEFNRISAYDPDGDNEYKFPEFIDAELQLLRYANNSDKADVVMTCDLKNPDQASFDVRDWGGDYALLVNLNFKPLDDSGILSIKDNPIPLNRNSFQGAYNKSLYTDHEGTRNFRASDSNKGVLGLFVDNFIQSIRGEFPTEYTYVLRVVPRIQTFDATTGLAIEKMIESNDVVVQVPSRTYRVGYQGFTIDQLDNDTDYENGLRTNRPGVAFTVANNPFVSQYEFRCTTHSRTLARVERYPGGVFRPFLVDNEDKSERELPRTAESFTGELSMLLDHWVTDGDEMTLVLHFRDSEENLYTNGNSYGFPLKLMPKIPKHQITYFNAGYSQSNSDDDTSEKTYHCGIQHITDYYQQQPDFAFAGYSVWAKGIDSEQNASEYDRRYYNPDMGERFHDDLILYNFKFGTRHLPNAGADYTVSVHSATRMYSEIKSREHVIPAYNELGTAAVPDFYAGTQYTGRYVVTDLTEPYVILSSNSSVVTGVDEIEDENAEIFYYNLQGFPVSENNLTPGIYIRKQGNKTDKIMIK